MFIVWEGGPKKNAFWFDEMAEANLEGRDSNRKSLKLSALLFTSSLTKVCCFDPRNCWFTPVIFSLFWLCFGLKLLNNCGVWSKLFSTLALLSNILRVRDCSPLPAATTELLSKWLTTFFSLCCWTPSTSGFLVISGRMTLLWTFWGICWNLWFPPDRWNGWTGAWLGCWLLIWGAAVVGTEGEKVVWNLGLVTGAGVGTADCGVNRPGKLGERVGALWPNLGPVLLSDSSIKICHRKYFAARVMNIHLSWHWLGKMCKLHF